MAIENAGKRQVIFTEYEILRQLKSINGSRLCELAILKTLEDLGFDIASLSVTYVQEEHERLWTKVSDFLKIDHEESAFFKYFHEFITQFSPNANVYKLENVNHIIHYLNTIIELFEYLDINKSGNIIEFGANNGILSFALQTIGQKVLCTDLHHGIVSNAINSYKVGTWIRENFIGINAVDTFKFREDNINNLQIFENGIDAIIMRGTGIFCLGNSNSGQRTIISRVKRKIKKILGMDVETPLKIIEENINELLKILSQNGVLYAKNENLFSGFHIEKRIALLNELVKNISDKCEVTYKIEETKYINPGWEPFNITLICKKK